MFPTDSNFPPPPGVFVSDDQSEVTSPVSLVEWLLGFHAEARKTKGCLEGLCHEGEVLHVPSGWWHLVINIEPSIAITQNFVPRGHLANVLDFMKNKPEQVSGFKNDIVDPYDTFVTRLREAHPVELTEALAKVNDMNHKKRTWNDVIGCNGYRGDQYQHEIKRIKEETAESDAEHNHPQNNGEYKDSHQSFLFGFGDASDGEVP